MSDYPLITTTFVDREVRMLRKMGAAIQIVASRRPGVDDPLSNEQRELQNNVLYLRPVNLWTLVVSHLYFLVSAPIRLFRSIFYLMSRPHPSLKTRFMTMLHIGRGVYAAYLLRNTDFEELHIHFAFGNAVSGMIVARLLGKTYTMSIHAGNDIFAYPVLLAEKIREARSVVTCTSFNKEYLEEMIGNDARNKITFIPHGLDLSEYTPSARNNGAASEPVILSVGALTERKGFVHLIQACHMLKSEGLTFRCEIIGEGIQRPILERRIQELSMQDVVTLTGALPHETVVSRYNEATLFVLPCIQSSTGNMDGIPNVVAEAMAMRLPVVSSRISGVPELVEHDVSGLLIEPGDDDALASAIRTAIQNPELRKSLSDNAYERIHKEFDVVMNTERLATILWPDWERS
jgi:glycosyltransferase involved in cell wall biosynthesis